MFEQGLQFLSEVAYVLVLVVTCADFAIHRDARRRDAVLMFASLAAFIVIRWAINVSGLRAPSLLDLSVLIIMAKPFLTLRLVRHFRPVPVSVLVFGFSGMVASWLILSVVPRPLSPTLSLVIVAYFVLVEGYAGVAFIRGAMANVGELRRRMAYVASGSVLLGVVLSIVGINVLVPEAAIYTKPISSLFTGLGALSYYLGFAPPNWIGAFWRQLRLGGKRWYSWLPLPF